MQRVVDPRYSSTIVAGAELRTAVWGKDVPSIVMMHDGLGSIPQWRSVPGDVAAVTGKTVMAYERAGHGVSLPVPTGPWPANWLDLEALVLAQVIHELGIDRPTLVGHSDGGSISLLHAASPTSRLAGVLAIAPHSWVEDVCFESIATMRSNRPGIVKGLARSHDAAAEVFEAWSGVWVSDEFRAWDIRPRLHAIQAPTLIAQGVDDPYASDEHAILTAQACGANASYRLVNDVGHIMHHDDPQLVVDLIVDFVTKSTQDSPAS